MNLIYFNQNSVEIEEEISSKELVERILDKEDQIKDLLRNL